MARTREYEVAKGARVQVSTTGARGKVKYLGARAPKLGEALVDGAFIKLDGEPFSRWYPLTVLEAP